MTYVGSNFGRPMYEDESDLAKERAVVRTLSETLGCTFRKLPLSYGLDYALIKDDRIVTILEIKCRDNSSQMYDTIMVSLLKRMKALEIRKAANVTTQLVIGYTDGVYMIDFAEKPDLVSVGGRKDRGDSADIEPVVHYNVARLKRVGYVDLSAITSVSSGNQRLMATSLDDHSIN